MIVFDTDHMTFLEWAGNEESFRLRARLEAVPNEERATTIVTFEEQTRGWLSFLAKARTPEKLVSAFGKLSRHLDTYRPLRVLNFDYRAAEIYQHLQQARIRVRPKDLQIAAIVLVHDATLLSRNLKDFSHIPGLKVEDWTT